MVSINRTEYFEQSHNLFPYEGGCFSLHGHSYKVTVEITGPQTEIGFIIDFKVLKKIMNKVIPDHAYLYDTRLLENTDPMNIVPELVPILEKRNMNVVGYPVSTSCENLVQIWADQINKELVVEGLQDVYVNKLSANETQNSQAVYVSEKQYNPYTDKLELRGEQ